MHILLVHNDYARFSGEENAVEDIAKLLEAHGHRLSWLRRTSSEIGDSTVNKIQALFSGIYSFDARKEMSRILDGEQIDLIQVQNLYPFISPSVLPECRKRGIPVVMRCPNYRLFCPNGLHLTHGKVCDRCLGGKEWNCVLQNCEENILKSTGYAVRNATARITGMIRNNVTTFVVLSEFQKQRFINGGIPSDRIGILPNIAPLVQIPDNADVGETVSFVGRVSKEKGIDEFLAASRRLDQLLFTIVGSTEGMPCIRSEASSNVSIPGFLTGSALDDLFNTSRILVFPSKWFEGFPNVIAKAMAHRKPVIAGRIGAIPEIVEDGVTGLLFEPGNATDLAEKIEYLWNQPDLCRKMGQAGLEKARREYSQENFYQRLINIYENARSITGAIT